MNETKYVNFDADNTAGLFVFDQQKVPEATDYYEIVTINYRSFGAVTSQFSVDVDSFDIP